MIGTSQSAVSKGVAGKLEIYDESQLPCIRIVMKHDLVERVMIETDARAVPRYATKRGETIQAGSI
jgi:hypothetical protein